MSLWWVSELCIVIVGDMESLMSSLGGGKWQCLACGYQSKSTNVRYHIEAKHLTSEGYSCPYCQVVIRNKGAYNNHLSQKHRNARQAGNLFHWIEIHDQFHFTAWIESMMTLLDGGQYQCSKCGYLSRNSSNVKRHIDAKHIVSSGYSCPHCPEVLRNKIALNNHLARAHKK